SHTDMEFHRVQLRVLEELAKRGRTVLVGLEMYPAGEQAVLDRWIGDAALTEPDFLKESRWYHNWGYHWEYYRAIFRFARENGARMYGLNVPRAVVQTARKQGLEALTSEQRALLPERIDTDSAEHRTLFKAFFSADDMHGQLPPAMFDGMFVAQCTWDGAMAHNAIKALKAAPGQRPIMVVLIGSGHVAFGLGAERQAKLWYHGRIASLIPIPVYDTEEETPIERARASYADFFWGVPAATDPLFPVLGLSAPEREPGAPMSVIQVEKESVAEAAGFAVGDVLVSMDGTAIDQKETFNRIMSEKRWGDSARFEVRRGEETKTLTAHFRRRFEAPPAPCATPPAEPAKPAEVP
ncbi:MAG: ChaN family lipoprotein, partial [Thermoanaerobaculia bacterium]|nr:ChaN family lipoprotein [Thermoanaerobaculia bacterium]